MAEKEGFEPSNGFLPLHDFQWCALDRATRLLHVISFEQNSYFVVSLAIINEFIVNVKRKILNMSEKML